MSLAERDKSSLAVRQPEVLILAVGAALLPVVLWPALAAPFELPKQFVLRLTALLLIVCWIVRPKELKALSGAGVMLAGFPLLVALRALAQPVGADEDAVLDGLATTVIVVAACTLRPRHHVVVLASIVVGATIMSAIALLQFIGLDPVTSPTRAIDWSIYADKMRMYATMGNPNMVAAVAGVGLVLALGLSRRARGVLWWVPRWAARAAALITGAALFVTFSKAAVVAGLCGLAVLWAMSEREARWTWTRRLATALAVFTFLGTFLIVLPRYSKGQNLPQRTTWQPWAESAGGRLDLWSRSLREAARSPAVGLGPGGLSRHLARAGLQARHAHNDYLETLADTGIPGGLYLLATLAAVAWAGVRRWKLDEADDRPLREALGAALIVAGLIAMVDFPLQRPAERTLFFLMAGLFFADWQMYHVPASTGAPARQGLRWAATGLVVVCGALIVARPVVGSHYLWKAEGLEQYGHADRAEAYYQRAAIYAADRFRVEQGFGRLALQRGDFEEALRRARAAEQAFPDPATRHLAQLARARVRPGSVNPRASTIESSDANNISSLKDQPP